ncbi:hypothetical protein BpHYR1_045410 [Brachionus plicatilis]|uniref:Protein NO VEIN C-terminal domain-containing protein n=1 Tax=Brachionus plicatilis TaxID=10195 RepID=A0A3M7QXR2_BRAPC|nr:hypothetical protein BpHYR1_045410 [Brachionus plicatilis]
MIEIIMAIHKNGCISDIDCIWKDLEFVKNHFNILKSKDFLSLTVPVISGLLPLKYSKIPTLLCFDLSLLLNDDKIIDFSSLKRDLSNYEILQWEYFFIKLGLDLPESNVFHMNNIFLRPLASYDERESELALKILNSNENSVEFIKLVPIKCSMESCSIQHQTVHLNSIELPNSHCIRVPNHAINLAEKMGIHTRLNSSLCINALETLVLENNKFSDEYLKWFAKLEEISEDFFFEDHIQSKKLICLKNLNQEKEFYSPNQVYVSGNNQIIEILGKYKTVINEKMNGEFLEFEHLMIKLGFKNEPNIRDLIELIILMNQDEEIFLNHNFLGSITFKGQNALKSIYFYLEKLLQKKANINEPINWETRLNLKKIINNSLEEYLNELQSLPILTIDNKLIRSENLKEKILVTSLNDQVNTFFQKENSSTHYVCNSEIAINCPFIMSIIGCIYLEPNSVIRLSHQTNNMEIVYPLINEMVKINSGLDKIEILNVVYIGADLVYDPLLNKIRKEDIHSMNSLKTLSLHSFDSILLDSNTLLCSTKISVKSKFMSVYQKGLRELLSLNFPNENIEQKLNSCMQNLDRNFESLRQRYHNWSMGSTEDSFYDMDQISFLENNNIPNDHVATNKAPSWTEEKLYKQRILKIINNLPGINRPSEYHIRKKFESNISSDKLNEIGRKAETFFYYLLNFIYPGSFEWVSSFKKGIFVNNFGFIDRLGYDFVVNFDNERIFSPNGKKCFIEVKGFADEWEGNFFFTKKQLNAFKLAEKTDDADYIIVIIDNLNNDSKTRIAEIFCLNENPDILHLESEVYKASVSLKTSDFGSSSNFSSLSDFLV